MCLLMQNLNFMLTKVSHYLDPLYPQHIGLPDPDPRGKIITKTKQKYGSSNTKLLKNCLENVLIFDWFIKL